MILKIINKIINKFNLTLLLTERYQNDKNTLIELRLKDYYLEIKKFLSEEIIIFDVGACDGSTALLYNEIFENFTMHLIEPNSIYLKKLKLNLEKIPNRNNNKFITHQVALGEKNEVKEYKEFTDPVLSGFFNINNDISNSVGKPAELVKKIKMKTETGDQFCKKNNIKVIDFMQINVQGFEPEIISGFEDMLKNSKIKFLLVEFDYTGRYERTVKISDLENRLSPYNYGLFDFILLRRKKADKIKLSYGLALFAKKEINDNINWI